MRRVAGLYREAYEGFPRGVWVLALVLLVNRTGTMVIPFLALYLTRVQGLSPETAGGIVALYGAGALVGNQVAGWASDRFGATWAMLASLVGTAVGFPLLAYLEGATPLAVGVFGVSAVAEVFRPASMTAAAELAPPHALARTLALMRLAINLGMAVGPAAGGLIAVHSYALLFWVDGLTCLAAAAVGWALLPRVTAPVRDDDPAAPAAARRSPWRDGPFLALLGLVVLMAIGFFQLFSTWPLYLHEVQGHDEDVIGGLLALSAGFVALVELPLVKLVERRDSLVMAAVGTLFIGAGFALLPLFPTAGWVAATCLVWTFGEMLAMPMTNVAVVERAPPRQLGRYVSLYAQAWSVAFILGPWLGTRLYEDVAPDAVWAAEAVLAVVLPAGFLALRPAFRRPR